MKLVEFATGKIGGLKKNIRRGWEKISEKQTEKKDEKKEKSEALQDRIYFKPKTERRYERVSDAMDLSLIHI